MKRFYLEKVLDYQHFAVEEGLHEAECFYGVEKTITIYGKRLVCYQQVMKGGQLLSLALIGENQFDDLSLTDILHDEDIAEIDRKSVV